MSPLAQIIFWATAAAPALFYILLCLSYRGILWERRNEIVTIMQRGQMFRKYAQAFGGQRKNEKPNAEVSVHEVAKSIDSLFYSIFGKKRYYFPQAFIAVVSSAAMLIILVRTGEPMLPLELRQLIARLPSEAIAALAGALLWCAYDAVERSSHINLTPASLLYGALRMFVAPMIAPLAGLAFNDSLRMLVAFGIGAFPVKTLSDFVMGKTKSKLDISGEPSEAPTLQYLQGMTASMLQRIQELGFESVEHLAGADPIRLLLRSNFPWKVILDLIDQAILFGYFGPDGVKLRGLGIRGAIELATVQGQLDDTADPAHGNAVALVTSIAAKLGSDETAVRNTIKNAEEDVQVNLIWKLWGDDDFDDDEDGGSDEPEPHSDS